MLYFHSAWWLLLASLRVICGSLNGREVVFNYALTVEAIGRAEMVVIVTTLSCIAGRRLDDR